MNKKEIKKLITKYLIFVGALLIIIGTGATYASLTFSVKGNEVNLIKAGCLKVDFTESAGINLTNQIPVTDVYGKTLVPYTMTINNTCSEDARYYMTFNLLNTTNLDNANKVKVYLTGDTTIEPKMLSTFNEYTLIDTPSDVTKTYLLEEDTLLQGESKEFQLRIWIDNNVTGFTGNFTSRIIFNAIQEVEAQSKTPESCFTYTETTTEVTITDYKCYAGNTYSLPTITDVVIPSQINGKNVTTIWNYAFQSNQLTSVIIPGSINDIFFGAFQSNQLTSVIIPSSITMIRAQTFENNQLSSIEIPATVTIIDNSAFRNNQLSSVTISNSVTSIGQSAFSYNQLTSVTIPNNVTTIYDNAFEKSNISNPNLIVIKNLTGKSFDWGLIVNGTTGYNWPTGTVVNSAGDVEITSS